MILNALTVISCLLAFVGTKLTFRYGIYGPDYNTEVMTYSVDTGKTQKTEEIKKKLVDAYDKQIYEVVTIENINPWRKINDKIRSY